MAPKKQVVVTEREMSTKKVEEEKQTDRKTDRQTETP